jgi:hypothetical protein
MLKAENTPEFNVPQTFHVLPRPPAQSRLRHRGRSSFLAHKLRMKPGDLGLHVLPVEHVTAIGAGGYILAYPIFRSKSRDCLINWRSCRRSAIASRVKSPCLSAFLLPRGAPDPGAPPCMRQRRLPLTAGDRQGLPERVLAPQRRLDSIGPVLRG